MKKGERMTEGEKQLRREAYAARDDYRQGLVDTHNLCTRLRLPVSFELEAIASFVRDSFTSAEVFELVRLIGVT